MEERVTRLAEMVNHDPEEPNLESFGPDQGLLTGSCELHN
jgi:hypothetical protein